MKSKKWENLIREANKYEIFIKIDYSFLKTYGILFSKNYYY